MFFNVVNLKNSEENEKRIRNKVNDCFFSSRFLFTIHATFAWIGYCISREIDKEEIFQWRVFVSLSLFLHFFRFNLSVIINAHEISEWNTKIANFVKFFVQVGLSYFHFEWRFTCPEIASTNEIWKLVNCVTFEELAKSGKIRDRVGEVVEYREIM